jgi:hypothetical protein
MPAHHTPIHPPPSLDLILRSRLAQLLTREGVAYADAARRAGWAESTLYRRLNTDPTDPNYRRLHVSAADELLAALELSPDELLQPVLLEGDRELLVWVGMRTPADPLPSSALWSDLEARAGQRVLCLQQQGLLALCGAADDLEDASRWYVRLTPAGQRALQ